MPTNCKEQVLKKLGERTLKNHCQMIIPHPGVAADEGLPAVVVLSVIKNVEVGAVVRVKEASKR